MKRLIIICSFVIALTSFAPFRAEALPIDGAISFSGTPIQDNLDLTLATAFTDFTNVVVSTTGGNGSYDPALEGQAVTFSPFSFRPDTDPILPLWTFDFDGKTYSFDVSEYSISYSDFNSINMVGTGVAYITGFDDTPGAWYFTANGTENTSSFSVSTDTDMAPVPEPATIILLGMGLLGTGTFARRKIKNNS